MNKTDFINKLSEDVVACAQKNNKGSMSSSIIANAILLSNYGNKSRAKNANNLFAIEADENDKNAFVTPGGSDTTKYKTFESLNDCIEEYVKNVENIEITEALQKIIDTYNLTQYDSNDEFIPEQKEEIAVESVEEEIKPVKEEVVINRAPGEEISSNKNIIDNDNKPSEIDTFIIKKGNESLDKYPNVFEEAKKICDEYPGYSVCNSKGVILYTSPIPTPSVEIKQNMLYRKGRKFTTKTVAIYINPNDQNIYRTYTGTLALYDGIERNGRYRVCKPCDIKNPRGIIGWVDKVNIN